MNTPSTPECDRMAVSRGQTQAAGEFVEWLLSDKGFVLAEVGEHGRWWPVRESLVSLLAEWHGIDLVKLEQEKQAVLAELQQRSHARLPLLVPQDEPPCTCSQCDHGVRFDADAARDLSTHEIRQRWPRLMGPCPLGCGFDGIAYASTLHYVAGDW